MKKGDKFAEKYGPWAVVVGGSEGIGAAFAEEIAARRINLVLVARREEKLHAFATKIADRFNVECTATIADVGTEDGVMKILQVAATHDVGLLVYNAAYAPAGHFLDLQISDHLRAVTVNSRNMLSIVHEQAGRMVQRGSGGIVIMCSLAGFQGLPGISTYAATKAFNIAMSEALHEELRPKGVDVVGCVAGATATPGFAATMGPGSGSNGSDGSRTLDSADGYPFWVMAPRGVARTGLRALGSAPLAIAGGTNKAAAFVMRHFFSRRIVVKFMAKASASPA